MIGWTGPHVCVSNELEADSSVKTRRSSHEVAESVATLSFVPESTSSSKAGEG